MVSFDRWQEIFATLAQHKLRTFLTGFGVFWGIFMLLLLLGAGNGVEKGVRQQFEGVATNSFFMWGQKTALPYNGMNPGREVNITESDLTAIGEHIKGIVNLNASAILQGEFSVDYHKTSGSFTILGTLPDLIHIDKMTIEKGRFLNLLDCQSKRKVAVIGRQVKALLFGSRDPIGEYIAISGVFFKVIGFFDKIDSGDGRSNPTERIYVPLSALQQTFNLEEPIHYIGVRVQSDMDARDVAQATMALLKKRHSVAPQDKRAFGSWNSVEMFNKTMNLFKGINALIWVVGIGTVMSGIIGVSNIMLIIVREKTREIGIRKAIGATPASIIGQILQESVLITSISGYMGLVAGVFVIEFIAFVVEKFHLQNDFFQSPEINLEAAIIALVLLILTGILAGLMPAYRAATINPIDALRSE